VDFIQVMGSDLLGRHGVELEEKSLEMIKSLRAKFSNSIIAIDIGVTEENAETLVDAGVNKLISGGAILNSDNPKEVYKFLESVN
jgi:pentose-5-phosphate-3-epimerase